MSNSWNSKVVIVTGASSGIGESTVHAFAAKGASVVLAARNQAKLDQLESRVQQKYNTPTLTIPTDVSREDDCRNLIECTLERFGRIDVLVNNAGISMRALFDQVDLQVIRNLMETNFWGSVYCTHYALPHLLKSKGSVVGVSSIAGYRGLPGRTGYSASKFAMQGFLESLRTENLHTGLHVMVICPGFTATNIRKVALDADGKAQGESPREENKMMTADEVADHLLRGVERRKRTVILTSQGKMTVFLNKWFPAWMDKMVFNHMAKEADSPFSKDT